SRAQRVDQLFRLLPMASDDARIRLASSALIYCNSFAIITCVCTSNSNPRSREIENAQTHDPSEVPCLRLCCMGSTLPHGATGCLSRTIRASETAPSSDKLRPQT